MSPTRWRFLPLPLPGGPALKLLSATPLGLTESLLGGQTFLLFYFLRQGAGAGAQLRDNGYIHQGMLTHSAFISVCWNN